MATVKLRRIRKDSVRDHLEAIQLSAESCCRQLAAWADALQNSAITGQRHLNDHTREQYRKGQQINEGKQRWEETRRNVLERLPEDHHLKIEARRRGEI